MTNSEITFNLIPRKSLTSKDEDEIVDRIIEFIENNGWLCGGGTLSYGIFDPSDKATHHELKTGIIEHCKNQSPIIEKIEITAYDEASDSFSIIEIHDV